jgi:outer membrane immunogenic protein
MRRILFATIGLLGFALTSAAAADLPRAMPPVKAPAYVPAVYSWNGFYVGINGGGAFGRSDWSAFGTDTNVSGGLVGVTAGYNWQAIGSPWVFGLEADIDWANIKGNFTNAGCPTGCETKVGWLGTARGRLGWAFDRVMPYITGGAAFGNVKATQFGVGSVSDTNVGWTAGAGIEAALVNNLTAKIEYLYVDLGDVSCAACLPTASNVDFRSHVVRAGLNFRF